MRAAKHQHIILHECGVVKNGGGRELLDLKTHINLVFNICKITTQSIVSICIL